MRVGLGAILILMDHFLTAQIDFAYQINGSTVNFSLTQQGQTYENVAWYFGDGNIVVSYTPVSHTYSTAGIYTVCVIGSPMPISKPDTACKTLDLSALSVSSINPLESIVVFPNPVSNSIQLREKPGEGLRVIIYSIYGTVVYLNHSQSDNEIDVSPLPGGVYYLAIESKHVRRVFKILKE